MSSKSFQRDISLRDSDRIEVLFQSGADGASKPMPHIAARPSPKVRIFMTLMDRTLGDFIIKSLFAAAVRCQFDDAFLTTYFHNDRPYKSDILKLNPHAEQNLMAGKGYLLPLEYFYGFGDRAAIPGAQAFIERGLAFPELIITPSMVHPMDVLRFDYLPHLGIPPDQQADLDQQLVDRGLDPGRWFCCIFYREAGYHLRPALARRDVDPEPFRQLIGWIIRELGGQVVRIGHPTMTPFRPADGFVDLIGEDVPFLLQAAAIARSRFGVVTNSGPASAFGALGTPNVMADAISVNLVWRDNSFALPRHFMNGAGEKLDVEKAIEGGYWNEDTIGGAIKAGFQPVDNSLAELSAAARLLYEETLDTPGWRPYRDALAEARAQTRRPNRHITNGPLLKPVRVIRFPELELRGSA